MRTVTFDRSLLLGIAEVWFWREGWIQPYCLRDERYVAVESSEIPNGLDLELLTGFIDQPTTFAAIRGFRQALRGDETNRV